jgi:hypothetical protein
VKLSLSDIRIDGGTQPRTMMEWETVEEYAELYKAGSNMPPVVVFYDGSINWLADGFHRYNAAQSAGLEAIDADVRSGTKLDAVWFSCSANQGHGIRRTNEDKRRAVLAALAHPRSKGLSDRQIADHCGVSHNLVNEQRRLSSDDSKTKPELGKRKRSRSEPNQKKKTKANRQAGAKKAREKKAEKKRAIEAATKTVAGGSPSKEEPKREQEQCKPLPVTTKPATAKPTVTAESPRVLDLIRRFTAERWLQSELAAIERWINARLL